MGNFGRVLLLLAGVVCLGTVQVSEAQMDDLNARLTSLETNQRTLRESLQSLEQNHVRDVDNVTQFCQGLKVRVEDQRAILERLQEAAGDNEEPEQMEGPCNPDNHKVLDDAWRSVDKELDEHEGEIKCDDDLPHGWYRFQLNGDNAVIPTSCVEDRHCQTHAPQWVDLQGQSLPNVGQEVRARACANWVRDCCNWESPITVRNCGAYFVYYLEPTSTCSLAYCAEPQP
ncbi:hypothetical protein ACOMHN_046436 [Nucella lapillus]